MQHCCALDVVLLEIKGAMLWNRSLNAPAQRSNDQVIAGHTTSTKRAGGWRPRCHMLLLANRGYVCACLDSGETWRTVSDAPKTYTPASLDSAHVRRAKSLVEADDW